MSPAQASKSEASCETERRIKSNTSNHPPITAVYFEQLATGLERAWGWVADAAERCKRTAASATFQRAAARPQRSPRTPATVPGHERPPSKCLLDTEYSRKRRNRMFCLWVQPDGRRQSVGRIVVGDRERRVAHIQHIPWQHVIAKLAYLIECQSTPLAACAHHAECLNPFCQPAHLSFSRTSRSVSVLAAVRHVGTWTRCASTAVCRCCSSSTRDGYPTRHAAPRFSGRARQRRNVANRQRCSRVCGV